MEDDDEKVGRKIVKGEMGSLDGKVKVLMKYEKGKEGEKKK